MQAHSHAYAPHHTYNHNNPDHAKAQTHIYTFNLYIILEFIKNLKFIKNTKHSLTLFSPWYFDFVIALGGGGKITPSYFISDVRMSKTWNLAQILSTLCSLEIPKNYYIAFKAFCWRQDF